MTMIPSVVNVRDLGGIALPQGTVRKRLLLRGGALACASDEDVESLSRDYRLAKVFDFRTTLERDIAPDREIPGSQNVWLPAFDETGPAFLNRSLPHEAYSNLGPWLIEHAREPFVQEVASQLYLDMVENEFTLVQYAGFMQNILQTGGGAVYWHCSQGKDRTGLGAAFLLGALGADRATIMADYCLSARFYAAELDSYLPLVETDAERTVLRTFISVNPDYFSQALDLLEDRCGGSFEDVLKGPLCLTDKDMETLRSYYLTTASL